MSCEECINFGIKVRMLDLRAFIFNSRDYAVFNMKNFFITTFLIILMTAGYSVSGYAGAWTAKQYSFFDKLAFNYYYSDRSYDSKGSPGKNGDNGKFEDYNVSNYFEFGLTDYLTAINSLSYKYLLKDTDQARSKGYGIGDIDLGLRCNFMDNVLGVFSAQAIVKIPGFYDKNSYLPLGNGQFDIEPRLLYGRSLYPVIPGYINLEAGCRWRAVDPSDEIRYLVEFGIDIFRGLYARAKLDGIKSLNNGKKTDRGGNPTTSNNYDLGRLDAALGYKITDNWGIELSYIHPLYGRNTAVGRTYSAGAFYKSN